MNNVFFDSNLCKSGDACRKCRLSRSYRKGIIAAFTHPKEVDFECPRGVTTDDFPQEIEPNIFQMAGSLVKGLSKEAKHRMQNHTIRKSVSPEEQQRRIAICEDCEFLVNGRRCAKCGCFTKYKAKLRTGECPIGKWRIVEETED